jgi:5'-nucleotidase / UDP-sugar diphosphatase
VHQLALPAAIVSAFALVGCAPDVGSTALAARLELVVLHTSDTHSALFSFPLLVGPADAARGLGRSRERRYVGGFARLATVLAAERRAAERVVHVDSGDLFQGSLTFERHGGEPEVLGFDALGVDAQVLGNHELDGGVGPLADRFLPLSTYPLLAANLLAEAGGPGLSSLLRPFALLDAGGLRVAVIGVGNVGSVPLLGERPNELGVLALAAAPAVQARIDELRPVVDVIVLGTHLGLSGDEAIVRATSGADLVLGGHQHLVLDEPAWVADCSGGSVADSAGRTRRCVPRRVPVIHSGAYGKFVGRARLGLDASLPGADRLDGYEVSSLDFELLPVNEDIAPDARMEALLAPYSEPRATPHAAIGFAPAAVERFGPTGGDSPLGNLAATAARRAALADLALIGASSLRHDLPPGLVEEEGIVRVLPFEDSIVRLRVVGSALLATLSQAARSAANRDCRTQIHVAGATARFTCPCASTPCVRLYVHETAQRCRTDADCAHFDGACDPGLGNMGLCRAPVLASESYELATTAYLAHGGSGLLPALGAGEPVVVSDTLADAVIEHLRDAPPCAPALSPGVELPCVDAGSGAVRDGRIVIEAP